MELYEDENQDDVTLDKKESMYLSEKQRTELNMATTPEDKAKLLHKWFYTIESQMDPEVKKQLKDSANYDSSNTLFWNIIDHCEEYGYPLFNRLNNEGLYEFLFNKNY